MLTTRTVAEDARATPAAAHADFLSHDLARPQLIRHMRERCGRFLLDHARPNSADLADAQGEFDAVIAKPTKRLHDPDVFGLARLAAIRGDSTTALRESQQALALLGKLQLIVWLAHRQVLLRCGNATEVAEWAAKVYDASTHTDDAADHAVAATKAALADATAASIPHLITKRGKAAL
jgi:hypothetical protein